MYDIDPKTHERKCSILACPYPMCTCYDGSGGISDWAGYTFTDRIDPLAYPGSDGR